MLTVLALAMSTNKDEFFGQTQMNNNKNNRRRTHTEHKTRIQSTASQQQHQQKLNQEIPYDFVLASPMLLP